MLNKFYEIIFTRCKNGVSITRGGQALTNEGFKVWSCSPEIYNNNKLTDLNFLNDAVQTKLSCTEGVFMDDAYLYYTPDVGQNFMVKFHPVKFNTETRGQYAYSQRQGNYLNHVLVGDFADIYPYELFGNDNIWYAQKRDEPYYYDTEPSPLPARDIAHDEANFKRSFERIKDFILTGNRRELLKKAAAFIISQFAVKNYKDRKFLVIKDNLTENIELWIAAIESLFSPRIASGISFAVRMDLKKNRYTVEQSGLYCRDINLQDPRQSIRYRAMIVGVNSQDKAAGLANADRQQFAVIDGENMQALFDVNNIDVNNAYFNAVTGFDDRHQEFCRSFLQMFNIAAPDENLPYLYKIFTAFKNGSIDAKTLSEYLKEMSRYELFDCAYLRKIYNAVLSSTGGLLGNDTVSAFNVIEWIRSASKIIGDANVEAGLIKQVKEFTNNLLIDNRTDINSVNESWNYIKDSSFASAAAETVINMSLIKFIDTARARMFINIYLEALNILNLNINPAYIKAFAENYIDISKSSGDMFALFKILDDIKDWDAMDMVLEIAADGSQERADFIIESILNYEPELCAHVKNAVEFCEMLHSSKNDSCILSVLMRCAKTLKTLKGFTNLAVEIYHMPYLNDEEKSYIYKIIDGKLAFGDEGSDELAKTLQRARPAHAKLVNSANIQALNYIYDYNGRDDIVLKIENFAAQGFPCLRDKNFIKSLSQIVLKLKLSSDALRYFYRLFIQSGNRDYISAIVRDILQNINKKSDNWQIFIKCRDIMQNINKKPDNWQIFIECADACGGSEREDVIDIAVDEICKSPHADKIMKQLFNISKETLHNTHAINIVYDIKDKVEDILSKRPKSFMGKVLGIVKRDKAGDNSN